MRRLGTPIWVKPRQRPKLPPMDQQVDLVKRRTVDFCLSTTCVCMSCSCMS